MNITKFKITIGVALNFILTFFIFGQAEIQKLSVNMPIERTIKGDEAHSYNIKLAAGQYLEVVVEQKGIDVVVKLFDSKVKKLAEAESPGETQNQKSLSFLAKAAGNYRLEVSLAVKTTVAGRYEIKIKTLRTATTSDKNSFGALQTFSEAQRLEKEATAESLRGAIKKYEEALILYRAAKDRESEAATLKNIGFVYYNYLKENNKARNYLEKSLQLSRYIKYKRGEAIALDELGWLYFDKFKKPQESHDYFMQAYPILDADTDGTIKTEALFMIGKTSRELSRYDEALKSYFGALEEFKRANDEESIAVTQNDIGLTYSDKGQFEKALDYLKETLKFKQKAGNQTELAITLNNIGLAYVELGNYSEGINYYLQALPNQKEDKAGTLTNIGIAYLRSGDPQKALNYAMQSLALSQNLNKSADSRSVSTIGDIYYALKDRQKALKFYTDGLRISRERGDKTSEAWTMTSLGSLYRDAGENQKALDFYNQALTIQTINKGLKGKARTLDELRNFWSSLGNPRQAIFYGKQAINTYQEIRSGIKGLDEGIQQIYVKTVEPTYRSLADILISEGRFPEAQAVLDLLKEVEFKQIARRSGEPLYTLPYSKSEEEALKIIDRLASIGRELSDLKAKPKDSLTAAEAKRLNDIESVEIPAANKALREATEALSVVAPDVKKVLDLKMENNIQNILPALGKGVVALYTVIGKTAADENAENKTASDNAAGKAGDKTASNKINVGWILLVTPTVRKAYPIDTTDLEQTVFKFREALRSPLYDPQPLAAELYKKLFLQTSQKQKTTLAADLEETLGKEKDKTLMWSLDGILRYVPMAALYDGKGYLVEKYRNVVFNTASLGSLKDSVKPNWEVVGLGVSTEGTVKAYDGRTMHFSALKGSESELNSIVKEKNRAADADGIFPGTLKMNSAFTRDALFEGARSGLPVIHISSHFWFNPAQEETSFLLLGNSEKLQVTEFQDYPQIFSNVDFLSLSACDTATGGNANDSNIAATEKDETEQKARVANGKEIEGFAYVAQTLGAKSVMASLWQVSDTGTKELMLKFYQLKKAQPDLPKGEALRQAQISLLRGTNKAQTIADGEKGVEEQTKKSVEGLKPFIKDEKAPFAHPYYWSPFIFIGNWK